MKLLIGESVKGKLVEDHGEGTHGHLDHSNYFHSYYRSYCRSYWRSYSHSYCCSHCHSYCHSPHRRSIAVNCSAPAAACPALRTCWRSDCSLCSTRSIDLPAGRRVIAAGKADYYYFHTLIIAYQYCHFVFLISLLSSCYHVSLSSIFNEWYLLSTLLWSYLVLFTLLSSG